MHINGSCKSIAAARSGASLTSQYRRRDVLNRGLGGYTSKLGRKVSPSALNDACCFPRRAKLAGVSLSPSR